MPILPRRLSIRFLLVVVEENPAVYVIRLAFMKSVIVCANFQTGSSRRGLNFLLSKLKWSFAGTGRCLPLSCFGRATIVAGITNIATRRDFDKSSILLQSWSLSSVVKISCTVDEKPFGFNSEWIVGVLCQMWNLEDIYSFYVVSEPWVLFLGSTALSDSLYGYKRLRRWLKQNPSHVADKRTMLR